MNVPQTGKPGVFARFNEDDILDEMGRLLFSIVNVFALQGYRIALYNNIDFARLDRYGQMVPELEGITLVDEVPAASENMFYLFDREDPSCVSLPWRKKIQVRFDIFAPYWLTEPLFLPYPVHPLLSSRELPHKLETLRKNPKQLRIFFSGDTKGYTRNRIHYPNTKLPRLHVIETLLDQSQDDIVHVQDEETLQTLFKGSLRNSCAIVDTGKLWVDPKDWLSNLSMSDFFICPPGFCMPMCHNVIEAMAVGTIPILNYPEWFNPDLVHMKNCIVFGNREDLVEKIKTALAMPAADIAAMRSRVIDYYEKHLNPAKFVANLESREEKHLSVLMITDRNTRMNPTRLNARSILITGKPVLANTPLPGMLRRFL